MKKLFYKILFKLGFWIPADKYLMIYKDFDWILIIFRFKSDGLFTVPKVGEYHPNKREFALQHTDWCAMNPLWDPVYCHRLPNPPKGYHTK